jgi:hypothetical protein
VKILQSKLSSLRKLKSPSNIREVQALNGFFNYFRIYIPNYARIMTPLFQLLKKPRNFKWEPKHQKVLETIRDFLLKEPCLAAYNPEYENILYSDASHEGLGVVFCQKNPKTGIEKPVYFLSRSISPAERNANERYFGTRMLLCTLGTYSTPSLCST